MALQQQAGTDRLLVLGLESSCDDTAAAVVEVGAGRPATVLSSVVMGQDQAHAPYGGVVPEIAARAHAERVDMVVADALSEADRGLSDIGLIAATAGPGLIGGVMAGLTFAKGVSVATNIPLVPVNHLAGHALSVLLEAEVPFPYLLLLVSGGHTQLLQVDGVDQFRRLGTTIDDAAGEAFDKTAKMLCLEGAGGPAIEALAQEGEPGAVSLPRPLLGKPGMDFSFSGLKTAVRQAAEKTPPPNPQDLAASFQSVVVEHLVGRTRRAVLQMAEETEGTARELVAAGGVAANGPLRAALADLAREMGWRLSLPSLRYCTDNAAMIAVAGGLQYQKDPLRASDVLSLAPRARWPLDETADGVIVGTGRKGRKV